ncbi:MAG TPA: DUF3618 domain-containing protein [Trebonia sp.]|jgi:ElaB/YqjD/DUF883 family membrane-anchored ribosome-binding protein
MTSTDNPQQLAEEIERTRAQLGETVEALTAKTDVKAMAQAKANQLGTRLKGKANQARQQASQQVQQVGQQVQQHPVPLAVSASAAVLVVLFIMGWRRP